MLPKLSNSQGAQFVAQFANQTTLTQNDARTLSEPALVPDISNVSAQIRLDALARYADAKLTTAVRGVNRCSHDVLSFERFCPSIHPHVRATSSACA